VSVEQYESLRSQALAAEPLVERIDNLPVRTKCPARGSESRLERPSRQPEPSEVKGDRVRLVVVLADLVVGEEEEQADE
jgi:hypothetical protein